MTAKLSLFMPYFQVAYQTDQLLWKTWFDGRQPLMEDNLCWNRKLEKRLPWIEDGIHCNTTFDGRQPLMEVNL